MEWNKKRRRVVSLSPLSPLFFSSILSSFLGKKKVKLLWRYGEGRGRGRLPKKRWRSHNGRTFFLFLFPFFGPFCVEFLFVSFFFILLFLSGVRYRSPFHVARIPREILHDEISSKFDDSHCDRTGNGFLYSDYVSVSTRLNWLLLGAQVCG